MVGEHAPPSYLSRRIARHEPRHAFSPPRGDGT